MRWPWVLVLLLPTVQAVSWSDPSGDVQFGVAECTWTDAPPGWYTQMDATEIAFEEVDEDLLELRVAWADRTPGSEANPPSREYFGVSYEWAGTAWWTYFEFDRDAGTYTLFHYIPDGYKAYAGMNVEPTVWGGQEVVLEANTARIDIQRSFFHHPDWSPMRAGDVIRNVTPFARVDRTDDCIGAVDLIGAPEDLVLEHGNDRIGSTFLYSPKPSRGSNGAATTYLYQVEARNTGEVDDVLTLQLGIPDGWVVRAPRTIEAPAGPYVPFTVAVSVPFVHLHGGREQVDLRAISSAEPGTASDLALSVWWSEPAQPGGHHPDVYLQARYDTWLGISTAKDPDGGTVPPEQMDEATPSDPEARYHWQARLNPHLSMGLDFQPGDVTGVSTLIMPLDIEATLAARLVLTGPAARVLGAQEQTLELRSGSNEVEWRFPVEGVDRVPVMEGQNLALEFELRFPHFGLIDQEGTPVAPPRMVADDNAWRLPLVDYHDIIDDSVPFAALALSLDEPQRPANPGRTLVFDVHARNLGAAAMDVAWTVEGPQAAWGQAPTQTRLAPGADGTVQLVVRVPDDARDGDRGTILLTGTDSETDDQYFARALVLVTTQETIPDQAALVADSPPPAKKSPGLPLLWVMLALLRPRH